MAFWSCCSGSESHRPVRTGLALYQAGLCLSVVWGDLVPISVAAISVAGELQKISCCYLVLVCCNLPMIMYSSFVYGEIPSFAALSVGCYLLLRLLGSSSPTAPTGTTSPEMMRPQSPPTITSPACSVRYFSQASAVSCSSHCL